MAVVTTGEAAGAVATGHMTTALGAVTGVAGIDPTRRLGAAPTGAIVTDTCPRNAVEVIGADLPRAPPPQPRELLLTAPAPDLRVATAATAVGDLASPAAQVAAELRRAKSPPATARAVSAQDPGNGTGLKAAVLGAGTRARR